MDIEYVNWPLIAQCLVSIDLFILVSGQEL